MLYSKVYLKGGRMKFYVKQHEYYYGIDLYARTMHICIIDKEGAIVKQKTLTLVLKSFYKSSRHTVRTL
jgi:hypothetical protein